MATLDDEDAQLRAVTLQNAHSIQLAKQRAEEELLVAKEALRESQERLQAALSAAGTGTFCWNIPTDMVEWDGNLDRLFGLEPGTTVHTLEAFIRAVHPGDRAAVEGAVAHCLATGGDFDMEFRVVWPDGSVHWIHDKARVFTDAAGRPSYMTGACADVTSRKMLLESERAARTAAERMSSIKDEFLATLSHELRTPLNAILGWAQVLRTGTRGRDDLLKGLETIERNARVQTQLIEDLLDMSRITSGKLSLDIRTILPPSFIEAAIETVKPSADAKGIRLERVLDPSAGPISGDPSRLQQVIWNLLSNSIKFTPKGGTVRVLLERVNSHIEISVTDTGIGIRPELIPHLFERFRQGDPSTTRHYGGLGLGLSIVENLVELHGGTVHIQSPGEGLGTTVTVHLPVSAAHRMEEGEPLHPGASGSALAAFASAELEGIEVLVVDDQPDARDLIQRVLENCGATVLKAGSATEALERFAAHAPDVLLTDIGMPDMDGFELLRRVRTFEAARGGRVPAIALTAFARSEDRTRALRAGFLVHVSKPVDPAELVATVASVAGRVDPPA